MKNNHQLLIFGIILLSVVFNLLSFDEGTDWGGDFASYLDQTRYLALNDLDVYRELTEFRFSNSSDSIAPKYYPWGLPILLTPIFVAFGFKLIFIKIYLYLFYVLTLVVSYFLFKNKLSKTGMLLLITFLAFNPYFFGFKEYLLSDFPFMFFSLLSVYLVEKFVLREEFVFRNSWLSFLLLGLVFFASTYIRSIGHLMIITFFAVQVIRNLQRNFLDFRQFNLPSISAYGIYGLLVLISPLLLPTSDLYANDFLETDFFNVLYRNLIYYISLPADFFQVTDSEEFAGVTYGIALPFMILGVLIRYRQDYLYIIFIVLTFSLLLIYPYHQGLRFIFPLLPFMLYFFIKGAHTVMKQFKKHRKTISLPFNPFYAFSILLIVMFLYADLKQVFSEDPAIKYGPYSSESREMFEYIRQETDPENVVIFRKPRVMSLFTGRRSVRQEELQQVIEFPKEYLVIDKVNLDQQLDPEQTENAGSLQKVFHNSQFDIYLIGIDESQTASNQNEPEKVVF